MATDQGIESPTQASPAREFKLGSGTSGRQKGRVTELSHPIYGKDYLIDVTEREDPTRGEPGNVLGNVFEVDLKDPTFNDRFRSNHGVIAVITDKLDPQGRKRVYVGVCRSEVDADDPRRIENTTYKFLGSEGFGYDDSLYVPFSFNSQLVRELMVQEIMKAVRESGDTSLFGDFDRSTLALPKG